MKKLTITLTLILIAFSGLFAQQFLTPVSTLVGEAVAETNDGQMIDGVISGAFLGPKGLLSFTIRDRSGANVRLKAAQVKSLKVRMSSIAKMETIAQQTSSISMMSNANFNEYNEREFIYFHQVAWPGNPGKYMLVQLLNEGWDNKIKVYDYPQKKTGTTSIGGINIAGGEARSFVVDYLGETSIVDRGNYKKSHFNRMFGNCAKLSDLNEKDASFGYFAVHVFVFETECE